MMYASPTDARGDVRERRGEVVVARRQRARGQSGEELRDGGEHHQRQHVLGRVPRDVGAEPREQRRGRPRSRDRDDQERDGEHGESDRPRGGLLAQPAIDPRPGERREHDEAERGRGEREHDEHPVRGEEPVGLRRPPEVPRDDHADHRGEAGLDGDREGGDGPCRERAQAGRARYACSTDAEA